MLIEPTDPASDGARALIARSDALMASLYPAESNHLETPAALTAPEVLFLGCQLDGQLVGCGAVKVVTRDITYGEIKRVFVLEAWRGRQLSTAIMLRLEAHLVDRGIAVARLETGIRQAAALGLYRKLGYVEREPFGDYRLDPLSVFMEKRLTRPSA